MGIVEKIKAIAAEKGATAAQIALAWVLAMNENNVPIPGTRKISRLEENVSSIEIDLNAEDLANLNSAAPAGVAQGERYPDMSTVNA